MVEGYIPTEDDGVMKEMKIAMGKNGKRVLRGEEKKEDCVTSRMRMSWCCVLNRKRILKTK